jgi:hypothetical protein
MKTEMKTLGFTVLRDIPTGAELNKLCATLETTVEEEAVNNLYYRVDLANLRPKIVDKWVAETGVKLEVRGRGPTRKDGTAPEILEKDSDYKKRLIASGTATEEQLATWAAEVANETPFCEITERTRISGRIAKEFTAIAVQLRAAWSTGAADHSTFTAKLEALNPGLTFDYDEDGLPTEASVARAIKSDQERIKREQVSGYLA